MSTSLPDPKDDKSLSWLLLGLIWQILVLVVPIFLVTVLPPLLALAVFLLLAVLTWLSVVCGLERTAKAFSRLLTGAIFGLGFSVGRALPLYWDIGAAFITILAGMAFVSSLERRLGLELSEPAASGEPGVSAWGGHSPSVTPEGEPIRVFNHGEIAMGGPVYCDYLFNDGVLLQGVGASARFSSDGRYFAAPIPSRQTWSLLILDRQQRRVYHCVTEQFWELDVFNEDGVQGRHSPLMDNSAHRVSLEQLLSSARAVDLVPVADLWLDPEYVQDKPGTQLYSPANACVRLEGVPDLPASLKDLPQPTDPLRYPRYRLSLDGQPSAMLVYTDAALIWNPDGSAFACHAFKDDQTSGGYWLWSVQTDWQLLPEPWVASNNEPSLTWQEPLELNDQYLWVSARFDYPQPDHASYGYQLHSIHSDYEARIGHDSRGNMQVADVAMTRMRLAIPLAQTCEGQTGHVESLRLLNGQHARLVCQEYNREGLGGYRCSIGDWELPGLWLLDHRVSDCTRYLALLPFAHPPAVCGEVVVVDVSTRSLLHSPALLAARLLDFRGARVYVVAVQGRLSRARTSTPLQRFDQPAPDAQHAAQFCRDQSDSQLYYKTLELQVENDELRLLNDWRMVNKPQAAVADGDIVQPSVDNTNAAWLFGCETQYPDAYLRPQSARMNGYLLTACGCALQDLAPSMIWSPAGRYLALTRFIADDEDRNGNHRSVWRVLLLDVQERSLRYFQGELGDCPEFVAFDHEHIHVRTFGDDWDPFVVDNSTVHSIKLSELLTEPAHTLEEHNGIWLLASQQAYAAQWQALDKSALNQWANGALSS